MSEHEDPALKFGIDRLVTNGKRIFGWGWVAHPTHAIEEVALRLEGDGWQKRLPVHFGLVRADVERAYPSLRNAGASGFVVTGYPPRHPARKLVLEVRFDDGATVRVDITHAVESRKRRPPEVPRAPLARARGRAAAAPRRPRRHRAAGEAQNYGAPSLDDLEAARRLLPALRGGPAVCVVFDHNLGGGANQYRRQLIAERLAGGAAVLLCTYNLPTLDYRLAGASVRAAARRSTGSRRSWGSSRSSRKAPVAEIFVNSPVSFDEPLVFADWIAAMRAAHPRRGSRSPCTTISRSAHPSCCSTRTAATAAFPDLAECAKCLPRHRASYVALSPPTEIGPWRALWGRCLAAADEVRCFSESTRRLLAARVPRARSRAHQRHSPSGGLRAGAPARARPFGAARDRHHRPDQRAEGRAAS